jgi:hypothetical protein
LTAIETSAHANGAGPGLDLRTGPLAAIRSRDLRSAGRDLWADEAALWERMTGDWASLDDAAWHQPGAAPSDAGGPPWSLAEHVGHIADWQELAVDYTCRAIDTGTWPSDNDFGDGDFDTFNEGRRETWASLPCDEILARLTASRQRLLELAYRLGPDAIRSDPGWEWVYSALHGHYLDHLAVIEPWTFELCRRDEADADPAESAR